MDSAGSVYSIGAFSPGGAPSPHDAPPLLDDDATLAPKATASSPSVSRGAARSSARGVPPSPRGASPRGVSPHDAPPLLDDATLAPNGSRTRKATASSPSVSRGAPTAIPKRRPRGATRDNGGTPRDNSARLAAKLRSAHL